MDSQMALPLDYLSTAFDLNYTGWKEKNEQVNKSSLPKNQGFIQS